MTSNSLYIRNYRTEVPGAFSDDRSAWVFPNVTTVTSGKKESGWQIRVRVFKMRPDITLPDVPEDAFVPIEDSFYDGQLAPEYRGWIKVDTGLEGTISKRVATIVHTGKSLKTAAATNVFTQALRDAYGLYNKQAKKSTSGKKTATTEHITTELLPPMLAQVLKDQKTPLKFSEENPIFVQPKYNGVRGVATLNRTETTSEVIFYSRRKNPYPGFQYIKDELQPILTKYWEAGRKLYLDGELYKHGVALQDISGYARREDQPDDTTLNYMIYDCFVANEPGLKYSSRKEILDEIFRENKFEYAHPVDTFEVYSMDEVDELYKSFLKDDFEGAMVRLNEPYRYSYNEYHSKVLLKIKPTYDAEMEVVGWETGTKGKAASALMIICMAEGKKFPVTPAMELPDRIALAKKMAEVEPNGQTHFTNHWLGKKIIITYDELSKDNVPQRARTKLEIRTWD